mmetsp:Transcript_9372/g.14256  ORF Transcript_9372/g.14256 Transcript_9372/m.14256 type:complete len:228 (-) Transcript_9372:789-1472(-)
MDRFRDFLRFGRSRPGSCTYLLIDIIPPLFSLLPRFSEPREIFQLFLLGLELRGEDRTLAGYSLAFGLHLVLLKVSLHLGFYFHNLFASEVGQVLISQMEHWGTQVEDFKEQFRMLLSHGLSWPTPLLRGCAFQWARRLEEHTEVVGNRTKVHIDNLCVLSCWLESSHHFTLVPGGRRSAHDFDLVIVGRAGSQEVTLNIEFEKLDGEFENGEVHLSRQFLSLLSTV